MRFSGLGGLFCCIGSLYRGSSGERRDCIYENNAVILELKKCSIPLY